MASILITGVSSGIGHALACACLDRGDRVFGLSRRAPVDLSGRSGFAFTALDLSDFPAIPPALARLLSGAGRLDLAVLNAGVLGDIADLSETSLDRLKAVMDVNVWANKAVLDALFSGGRDVKQVVAISSGASVQGARGRNGYSISKAALNMLIQLYASERPQTHFSALAPGMVDTPMQDPVRALPAEASARFGTVARLLSARGTPDMPTAEALAPRLLAACERLLREPSGEFHDLRRMR